MVTTTKLWMSVGPSKTRINLLGIRGWHQNGWKEADYGSHVGEITEKTLILKNQHHFFTKHIWDVFNVNANLWNIDKTIYKDVRITNFCWSNWKNYRSGTSLTPKRLRGPTTWKDMLKNTLKDTANWQRKRQSSCTKFHVFAWLLSLVSLLWMYCATKKWIHRRRSLSQWENYPMYAHKLSWNAWT